MKYLIVGASGLVGHVTAIYLYEKGHKVDTLTDSRFDYCGENHNINLRDLEMVKEIIDKGGYDIIVNCTGVLNEAADRDKPQAVLVNGFLPHYLAEITLGMETWVIHLSTDCIFSGTRGRYKENDPADAMTFYNRTKAIGEIADSKNLTFRNSKIGPEMNKDGIGLFNWFMKQKGEISGYTGAIWNGVTSITMAKAIECVSKQHLTGLYQLVNQEGINKFELLKLFNKYFRNDSLLITPNHNIQVDKSLWNTRSDFDFEVPSYEEMMTEMKQWMNTHKQLYPQYYF